MINPKLILILSVVLSVCHVDHAFAWEDSDSAEMVGTFYYRDLDGTADTIAVYTDGIACTFDVLPTGKQAPITCAKFVDVMVGKFSEWYIYNSITNNLDPDTYHEDEE